MPYLDKTLRKQLASTIQQARVVAEDGAADALRRLGVAEDKAPAHVTGAVAELRVKLRAHARTLGDGWDAEKKRLLSTSKLVETVAFEHWHRMLFGRFLVERGLLIHPDLGVPVAQEELAELAAEEGLPDAWGLVERIAAPALPAVFKPEDPALAVTLAPEFAKRLRDLVVALPQEVFVADDSLGWTYQFWRAAEKERVDAANIKIGASELPAVTQLFTEPYMVLFLLHNVIGGWWAGKVLAADRELANSAPDEETLRAACAVPGVSWEYLRFIRSGEDGSGSWVPAAGTFPDWPLTAAEITFCDPCCGSGHFLVEALALLCAIRQQEENLSREEVTKAVLSQNLHGLELDGRCVQIAAFNVALAAWNYVGTPVLLPSLNIGWVGAPPPLSRREMAGLAGSDVDLARALEALHDQFAAAPILGSLMEVGARDLIDDILRQQGEAALNRMVDFSSTEQKEGIVAARGLFEAVNFLSRRYVFIATNVPFLGKSKQDAELSSYISSRMPDFKSDLATAMLERLRRLAIRGGAVASVTPQTWLYLKGYEEARQTLIDSSKFILLADLGPAAFRDMNWWAARTALVSFVCDRPNLNHEYSAIEADTGRDLDAKPGVLKSVRVKRISQQAQKKNPDTRMLTSALTNSAKLSAIASSLQGIKTGDDPALRRHFWEVDCRLGHWKYLQTTVENTTLFGGLTDVVWWRDQGKSLARLQGVRAYGQIGCAVSQMGGLPCAIYVGEAFDSNVSAIVFADRSHVLPSYAYMASSEFASDVRKLEPGTKANNAILAEVPFDLGRWKPIADKSFPDGLPEPCSDDPTQWIFHGHPRYAANGAELHVALARLAGYRWPAETDPKMWLSDLARERIRQAAALPVSDADGLLTLHATGTDRPLADRLRAMLAAAFDQALTPTQEAALVRAADERFDKRAARDTSLESWLRDRAFRQHCVLFQQRPFLWQVWDGGRDGFSAFLHYHRLNRAALEKLTYTLLGDWIARMTSAGRTAEEGWALQLRQRLVSVLESEKPYDIFVRWKPLERQPIGWEPDLDDGVRVNIRAFVEAGVLRETPKINWNKDRGTDPSSAPWFDLGPGYGEAKGARINDHHLTLAEKRAARAKAKP